MATMPYRRLLRLAITITLALFLMGASAIPPGDKHERVRAFTRQIEFDYVAWTLEAVETKLAQAALRTTDYLPEETRRQMVLAYLDLIADIQRREAELEALYANPEIADPASASSELRARLSFLYAQRERVGPLAEAILEEQIATVVAEMGLALGGQPLPAVLYHSTPLPLALIVSPRDTIRQDANISLTPEITIDQRAQLEAQVDAALNVSSLVVGIGGVGVYPTMVMQTSDLNFLVEVVAHEWTRRPAT